MSSLSRRRVRLRP